MCVLMCDAEVVGIYFMKEWLNNRLSAMVGPYTFGLPYQYGRLSFQNDPTNGTCSGNVIGARARAFGTKPALPRRMLWPQRGADRWMHSW